jgi:hypothetical protein
MLYQLFTQEFKNLTGLQGIAMGQQSKGDMTASEATVIAMSSSDRLYLQSVFEESFVKELMELVGEVIQYNYTPDRWIRIIGDDNQMGVAQVTSQMKEIKFDVSVAAGVQLPFDEEKRRAGMLQAAGLLESMPANPLLPDILTSLNVRNAKKIIGSLQAYQNFKGLQELYGAVTAGKMTPEDAANIILMKARELYQQSPQAMMTNRPQGGGGVKGAGGGPMGGRSQNMGGMSGGQMAQGQMGR